MTGFQPTELVDRWREDAARIRLYGGVAMAEAVERCAQDLVTWWNETTAAELTTEEAEALSGYTRSALEQMRRTGKLTSAGRPHAPRYILGELPRKAARRERAPGEPDLAGEVLAREVGA